MWVISTKYAIGEDYFLPQLQARIKASVVWEEICAVGNQHPSLVSVNQQGFKMKVYNVVLGTFVVGRKGSWAGILQVVSTFSSKGSHCKGCCRRISLQYLHFRRHMFV